MLGWLLAALVVVYGLVTPIVVLYQHGSKLDSNLLRYLLPQGRPTKAQRQCVALKKDLRGQEQVGYLTNQSIKKSIPARYDYLQVRYALAPVVEVVTTADRPMVIGRFWSEQELRNVLDHGGFSLRRRYDWDGDASIMTLLERRRR